MRPRHRLHAGTGFYDLVSSREASVEEKNFTHGRAPEGFVDWSSARNRIIKKGTLSIEIGCLLLSQTRILPFPVLLNFKCVFVTRRHPQFILVPYLRLKYFANTAEMAGVWTAVLAATAGWSIRAYGSTNI